jgi:hypothetical protein
MGQLHGEAQSTAATEQRATVHGQRLLERDGCNANDPATHRTGKTEHCLQARVVTTSLAGTELNTEEISMKLNEMLNPWKALRKEKLEVAILKREQAVLTADLMLAQSHMNHAQYENVRLMAELAQAQKNDTRGKDGKFKKGEGK